jgi:hypothetical protein
MNPRPPITKRASDIVGKTFTTVFVLFWLTMWTVGTAWMDVRAVRTLVRQTAAAWYPSTTGTVVRNERVAHAGNKGGTYYTAKVGYAYAVDGRPYEGTRVRFDRDSVANAWADAHPVGSAVRVYYDPRRPWDCAVETGLVGWDLGLPLVAVLFNGVALFGWWCVFTVAASPFERARAPRLRIRRRWRGVLVPRREGRMLVLGCMGVLVVVILVVAAIVAAGFLAGRGWGIFVPLAVWIIVLSWLSRQLMRMRPWAWRDQDLELDPTMRTLRLPVQPGAPRVRQVIEFERVLTVEVSDAPTPGGEAKETAASGEAEKKALRGVRFVALMVKYWQSGRDPRTALVGMYSDVAEARLVRDWLVREMRLPASAAVDSLKAE